MKKPIKRYLVITFIVIIFVSIFLEIPNSIRYSFEKKFGNPLTFFYGLHLAVMVGETNSYEEEINLDDAKTIKLNFSKHNALNNASIYIYGSYVNSSDNLVVILNDKVIFNGSTQNKPSNFYERYYIQKNFVIELQGFMKKGTNRLVITTGKANEVFEVISF